jgi:hypothetical protein
MSDTTEKNAKNYFPEFLKRLRQLARQKVMAGAPFDAKAYNARMRLLRAQAEELKDRGDREKVGAR